MENRQKRGLCYNYDEKYSPGHKCKEKNVFHIDVTCYTNHEELIIVDTTEVEMDYHTTPMQEIVEFEIP